MPPKVTHDPAYLDEHHQRISEFAAEYFEDEEERDGFIGELMTRRGYKSKTRTEWEPADPPADPPKPPAGPKRPSYFK